MKILRKILHFLLLIAALIIQITFFEHLKMFNIYFDLVLIIVVVLTLTGGAFYGIISGFIAGILLDLIAGDLAGISALIYALDAFIVWRLVQSGLKYRLLSQLFLIFAVTEANILIISLIRFLFNYDMELRLLGLELLLKPAFNILLMLAIYPAVSISLRQRTESLESKY
jgi:rod shape-determining protein MreD